MIRILITGSRTWDSADVIHDELDLLAMKARDARQPITVVHGGARGVDRMAGAWARQKAAIGWPVAEEVHPVTDADWRSLGKRAGMVRNQHMVDLGADVCLAFIRDNSPGATACARMAEAAGIKTVRTHYGAAALGVGMARPVDPITDVIAQETAAKRYYDGLGDPE